MALCLQMEVLIRHDVDVTDSLLEEIAKYTEQ
jgi:hypothetical protein